MAEKLVQIEVGDRELRPDRPEVVRIALLGNPNTGKTTLFNRLSGLRHKTSNFPGTTLEARVTRVKAGVEGGRDGDLIDLPGIYSIELEELESKVCRDVLSGSSAPAGEVLGAPEVVVVVVDATNLGRNLMLVGEVMRRRLPTVVVMNMTDLASRQGLSIDESALSQGLGCEVVRTNARDGIGIDALRIAIRRAKIPAPVIPVPATTDALRAWADQMYLRCANEPAPLYGLRESLSDKIDRVLLHPLAGSLIFALIMGALFYTIFSIATYPMEWIEAIFAGKDTWIRAWQPEWLQTLAGTGLSGSIKANLPEGLLVDLLADGIVAGVGSTVVFLPQICILFFLICLLEDTGYLARASFVMDRLLRPFGLSGQSFVPFLSSHACALPGIIAARGVPDLKQRLTTILVAPFLTCSARIPVYILLTTLLFGKGAPIAALAMLGCYALGIVAAMLSALLARKTILRGRARPMAMELPSYKRPSIRTALLTTFDRGWVFLRNAGTVILAISIVMWWLGEYPKAATPPEVAAMRERVKDLADEDPVPVSADREERITAAEVRAQADHFESINQKTHSYMGRIGRTVQPAFSPMDWDWRVCIGVMASFAAREVFVATMSVVVAGEDNDNVDDDGLIGNIRSARRDDGLTPVFTPAVSWSLLVFYVLAMQCLATLALTAKEAGGWKWAALQFSWMTAVAYLGALITFHIVA